MDDVDNDNGEQVVQKPRWRTRLFAGYAIAILLLIGLIALSY